LATVLGGQIHAHIGWQGNFAQMAVLAAVLLLLLAAWRGLPEPRLPVRGCQSRGCQFEVMGIGCQRQFLPVRRWRFPCR